MGNKILKIHTIQDYLAFFLAKANIFSETPKNFQLVFRGTPVEKHCVREREREREEKAVH